MHFGVQYSPLFKRQYKKLPEDLRRATKARIRILQENPYHPRLKTHKLTGSLKGFLACSVTHLCRIIFEIDGDIINLYEIGNHDIYD